MELLYVDDAIVVCVKPSGVKSTDEPGGVPELVREALHDLKAQIRTVHRLDQVVSGLMVLARTEKAASELSRQIREQEFGKEYLAVIHGCPDELEGTLQDLLYRDKARRMTFVADTPARGVQEASLEYRVLSQNVEMSRVAIRLHTGRTHQIRVQMAGISHPIYGDMRYGGALAQKGKLALWAYSLSFLHPITKERLKFIACPPETEVPWKAFDLSKAVEIK